MAFRKAKILKFLSNLVKNLFIRIDVKFESNYALPPPQTPISLKFCYPEEHNLDFSSFLASIPNLYFDFFLTSIWPKFSKNCLLELA